MILKRIFCNKQWWTDLSTNFFGALLGIVVTFGTTGYLEHMDKKEMGRKIALMTIGDIEYSIRELEADCEIFQQYDTIFRAVSNRCPDRLDEVHPDTMILYLNSFFSETFYVVNPAAEGVFSHSSDIWRTLDNYALQQRIGYCFALRNRLNDFSVRLKQRQIEIGTKFFSEKRFSLQEDLFTVIRELTGLPAMQYYFTTYPFEVEIFVQEVRNLRALNYRNMQDMGLTPEELEDNLELFNFSDNVESWESDRCDDDGAAK